MCRHMADPNRHVPLFVERLSLHVGSREDAIECARRDLDQYVVRSVSAWKGNPLKRKSMKFWVEYDDGDSMWVSWKADLVACQQYQDFIHSLPELFVLRYSHHDAPRFVNTMRSQPIIGVVPGDTVLRAIKGCDVYDSLDLPNAYTTRYVCSCTYSQWIGRAQRKIEAFCPLLDVNLKNWDSYDVFQHGSRKVFDDASMTLVTEALCLRFPAILEAHNRKTLIRTFQLRTQPTQAGEG